MSQQVFAINKAEKIPSLGVPCIPEMVRQNFNYLKPQPVILTKEVTYQEYVNYHKEEGTNPGFFYPGDYRYFEISTD